MYLLEEVEQVKVVVVDLVVVVKDTLVQRQMKKDNQEQLTLVVVEVVEVVILQADVVVQEVLVL
tara:strand:- start:114 stop:305 length:192 start_codon:yes stop_codon:yes gene_type:complete